MESLEDRSQAPTFMAGSTISFLFMIGMNFLANYLPLNNVTTGEVSEQYYNIFTPAGFTFIIWGVIYVALAVAVIGLIRGVWKGRERESRIISVIGWYFIISSLLNGIWIYTWHYDMIAASLAIIFGLLVSLTLLYTRLKASPVEAGKYSLPFSIYLGWVTVATLANLSVFAVAIDRARFGLTPESWLTLLLLVVLAISAYMIIKRRDSAYGLVIVWALIGISAARWSESAGLSYPTIAAVIAAILVASILGLKEAMGSSPEPQ